MDLIVISATDLTLAAAMVLGVAALSVVPHLKLASQILVAGARTTVQLLLVGLVLDILFSHVHLAWISAMALVMLAVAGHEVMARQRHRFGGWWGYGLGTGSMFVSSFAVTVVALTAIIQPVPWYTPQYAIPLLGMMLGNTMNGVAIAMDRLSASAWQQQGAIEARLSLGATWQEAIREIRQDSVRGGMIPTLNAMAAAGIVSLPGMMTGQILSGTPPVQAVNYQILVMFLVAAGSGVGTVAAAWLGCYRLFDERHRLRLDRLR
jgi:putative ABC transport system permease protein